MMKFKIKEKAMIVNILIIPVLMGVILGAYKYQRNVIIKKTYSELNNINSSIINMINSSNKSSVKSYLKATSNAYTPLIKSIYNDYINKKYTKEEALKIIKSLILTPKIGDSGYIYIIDSKQSKLIIHPYIDEITDINQSDILKKILEMKNGYIEYSWKNPNEPKSREKIAYLNYIKELDAIIVVSVYKDELNEIINIESFREEVLSIKSDEDGYSYIITDEGSIVIHPYHDETTPKEEWNEREFIKKISLMKTGSIDYFYNPDYNGDKSLEREKLAVFNYIPDLKWIVVTSSYKDDFMKPALLLKKLVISSIILLIILGIIQHQLLNIFIVKPLDKFILSIKSITKNQFLEKIKIDNTDEIGELSKEFNNLINQILSYENGLKEMVSDKTKELRNINKEIKETNHTLLKNEELLGILFETIPYPLYFKDENFNYVRCNLAFANYLEIEREKLIGKNVFDIFSKELADVYHQKDIELFSKLDKQEYEVEMKTYSGNKDKIAFLNKAVCVLDNKKIGIIGLIQDMTNIRKREKKLEEENVKDHLTTLYNRRGIEKKGEFIFRNALLNKKGLAVLMIDVDYFKLFNDRYGHQAGDDCLTKVGITIKEACYRSLDLAGRYGGEEFIVILPEITERGAFSVAERIREKIKDMKIEHLGNKNEKVITVSIGGTFSIPKKENCLKEYIKLADTNLYIAKKNGRNRVKI